MQSWHRHLEGWQLAVITVGMALYSAVLVVPRSVVPREVPLPVVDRRTQTDVELHRKALVEGARVAPLPFLVRATGEALRAYGEAEFEGNVVKATARAREVAVRAAEARKAVGPEPLLALRAVQTELFVRAVTTWVETGEPRGDIVELGGAFVKRARRDGWVDQKRLVVEEDGLAQVFVMRWTKLAGFLDTQPFVPTLNELRLYFRTLIAHPESPGGSRGDTYVESEALAGYVAALHKQDPDYPADLANGVLSYRQTRFDDAAELFAAHLRAHPGGRWRLRAQNYYRAAREHHVDLDEFDQ